MDLGHTLERNWRRDRKMQFCCCWGGCWGDCCSLISSYASWVADRALFPQWHPHFVWLLILTQRVLVCSRHPNLSISHPLASLRLCLFLLKNLEPSIRALQSLHSSQQVSLMPRMLNLCHWTKALTSSCWFLVLSVLIQKHFRWGSLQPHGAVWGIPSVLISSSFGTPSHCPSKPAWLCPLPPPKLCQGALLVPVLELFFPSEKGPSHQASVDQVLRRSFHGQPTQNLHGLRS